MSRIFWWIQLAVSFHVAESWYCWNKDTFIAFIAVIGPYLYVITVYIMSKTYQVYIKIQYASSTAQGGGRSFKWFTARRSTATTVRKPWSPLEIWASIPIWLKRMRMVRGGYMEKNEVGDFEWYTMAVAKPCKIPNGLAMQMITMLRTHNVHDLAPLLEAGILERKDETPAAPYHVEQEKLSAIWSRYCVVWLHRNGRGPMNCTCWFNR